MRAISSGSGFPFGLRVFVKNISTVPGAKGQSHKIVKDAEHFCARR